MTDRARTAFVVAAGIAAQGVLLLAPGAGGAWPRLIAAFVVLVLLPGYAFVALGGGPPGGAWLAPGWALGFGVAWLGALVLVTRALGLPFTVLAGWSVASTALLWAIVLWRPRGRVSPPAVAAPEATSGRGREPAPEPEHGRGGEPAWSRASLVALVLAVALGAWYAGRLGAPIGLQTDSPDHIGTIRRMMETGDAFPRDAFFRDARAAGADPRKGLWHPQVALIARLARLDPYDAWRMLPACLVPLFLLNAAVLGFLLNGGAGAAVAAWALLLTYGGSLAAQFLREAVFATKLGDQLALAAVAAAIADLEAPSRRMRLAAVGLALGALAAHVYYSIQFAMVFASLAAGLALADRGWSARVSRLAGTALALGAAGLPYLLWRASQSYAPNNIIHTAPQGLMRLWGNAEIVSIGVLWDWLGGWWILFPLAAPWLWRAGRRDPAVLFLLTTPAAVALVIFDPPVVALLQPRLGYLLMRMVWMLPLAGLLAWMLPALVRAARRSPGLRRLAPALALAGVLAISWDALRDAAAVVTHPGRLAALEAARGTEGWDDALARLRTELPRGSVVLSDPATSYAIPMRTGLFVATLVDQHSSPNDPHALQRILDARDALDPWASWARVREVVARYGVDAIVLNDRFRTPPALDYWGPNHEWFLAARARFDALPVAFEPLDDGRDFVAYRIHRAALDTLSAPVPPRPFVSVAGPPGPGRAGDDPGLPTIESFTLSRPVLAPGDSASAEIVWRGPVRPGPRTGSCMVAVRFDRDVPGLRAPEFLAKPARKLIERLRGERYRFRVDHLPAGGDYGVDLWRSDERVRDRFAIAVPADASEGSYTIRVRMLEQPHYPNYRLRDYFFEDDYYAGRPVGTLRVSRDAAARPGGGG